MTEKKILEALKLVEDPDFQKDIVSLNMVQNIKIEGLDVSFDFVLTTPACPMKDMFVKACTTAIRKVVNDEAQVHINFTSKMKSNTPAQTALPNVGAIIAVYSAKGGVGKSTVAANFAVALAKSGAKVGLLDADIYGPSIPTLFELDDTNIGFQKENDKNKMVPFLCHGVYLNSLGFLTPKSQPIPWRGPMASTAIKQLIFDTLWPPLDYLIVDMPPGTGDIHLTLMQSIKLAGAIVVSTPHEVAVQDTRRAISMLLLESLNVPVLGLVENMSYLSNESGDKQYIFGKEGGKHLAEEFGIVLLGEIPIIDKMKYPSPLIMVDDESNAIQQTFQSFVDKTVRLHIMRSANVDEHIISKL